MKNPNKGDFFKDALKLVQFNMEDEQMMSVSRPPAPPIMFNEIFWLFRLICIYLFYILWAEKMSSFTLGTTVLLGLFSNTSM